MKLPNRNRAFIPAAKITEYLLSTSHPYGRHKAALFMRFGFSGESWDVLASALVRMLRNTKSPVLINLGRFPHLTSHRT